MFTLSLKVQKKNGLHIRLAATFIITLQSVLKDKDAIKNSYVIYKDKKVQANNLLSLVSLKIEQGEEFLLTCADEIPPHVAKQIVELFEEKDVENVKEIEADLIMMENSYILQEAFTKLPNGVVVVDRDNVITYVNDAAVKLLEKPPNELYNHKANIVIPQSRLHTIMKTGQPEFAQKQKINHYTILTNRSPLIFQDKVIGAVAVFQDISNVEKITKELKEVQELQQRLDLVLQSVSDLIALTNEKGEFIFINEEMQGMLIKNKKKKKIQSIIGDNLWKSLLKRPEPFMKIIQVNHQLTYITKINPIIFDETFRGTVVTLSPLDEIKILLQKLELMEERTKYLERELSKHQKLNSAFNKIIGNSEVLLESLSMANKVSKTDSTVLITGESGTGKELVARAIHETSDRCEQSYIRVNCSAISPNLIESELFGHEKGAFTGAYKVHRGKFELADNGTIFLDEIGDLNLDLQVKLLRVLQEKEVDRVGGFEPVTINVRVIAATNRDLAKMIEEGKFREDLYYRLNVIPIHLPPLRSRKEDIPLLSEHFRVHFNQHLGKSINRFEQGLIEILSNYDWPGNIRELENIIERLFNLTDDDSLKVRDLPHYIYKEEMASATQNLDFLPASNILTLEEYERQIFTHACQFYPSYNQLSHALGITHKTAAKKIRKYGLEHLLGKKYQNT